MTNIVVRLVKRIKRRSCYVAKRWTGFFVHGSKIVTPSVSNELENKSQVWKLIINFTKKMKRPYDNILDLNFFKFTGHNHNQSVSKDTIP